jgi:uncharacterized membrane-anchored protein YhcB (DUF1043 family)
VLASGFWIGLVVGLFVGAFLGIVIAALMAAAANADRTAEKIYRALPDQDPEYGVEHRERTNEEDPDSPAGA